jgi:hypothetical protein
VIVLWTKTDSLDLAKIKQLMKEGNSKSDAMKLAPQQAWADYEKNIYQHFDGFKYPPKAFVVFRSKCYYVILIHTWMSNIWLIEWDRDA